MSGRAEDRRSEWIGAGLLLAACVPLILWGLGRTGLVNGDEEIYHVIAVAMVESGDWSRLDFYGEHRVYDTFMNAPIQYWVRATLIAMFGASFWTMRIASALFAVASVLLTHRIACRLSGPRAGLLAGAVQLTTLQFVHLHGARTGELEPVLAFLYTAFFWTFARAALEARSFVPAHLCLALLLNLKVPTVLIPGLAACASFALLPAVRPALRRFVVTGLWVIPLGLLWHVGQVVTLWDGFVEVVTKMGDQASGAREQKFLPGAMSGVEAGPLRNATFYARTIAFGAFPWVLAYPFALVFALRDDAGDPRRRALWRIAALHVAAVLLFYVFVGKHHQWYVMPIYPLLAIFVAHWLTQLGRRAPGAASIGAAALLLTLCGWVSTGALDFNPFAVRAYLVPMEFSWRGGGSLATGAGVVLTALLLAAGLGALRSRWPARAPAVLSGLLVAALLGVGTLRVVLPLAHVGHLSETARFERELAGRRARGDGPSLPLTAPVRWTWETRYYFERDYDIVRDSDGRYRLYEQGDPRAQADRRRVFARNLRAQRTDGDGAEGDGREIGDGEIRGGEAP